MQQRILMIGDIVGRAGRLSVCRLLPGLIASQRLDFVVANAENICEGSGITPDLFEKLLAAGVDVCTMGDHAFRKKESLPLFERSDRLLRPGNWPAGALGRATAIRMSRTGVSVAVLCAMGQVHMKPPPDSPWSWLDRTLATLPASVAVRLVELHAEVTSEKVAMGRYLDGRVSAVVGTHTHVPTADEVVLPGGTAYITDLGMTGAHDSVLGRRTDRIIKSLSTGMPQSYDLAEGDPRLSGVILTVESSTGRAESIQRVQWPAPTGGAETEHAN